MNEEAKKQYARAYYQANKKRIDAQVKAWRERNPDKAKAINRDVSRVHMAKLREEPEFKASERAAEKIRRKATRRFIEALRIYYGCTNPDCMWDGPFTPPMLEFHHIDPSTKLFSVSQGYAEPKQVLADEINKCCILCANCHRLATHGDLDCAHFTRCNTTSDQKLIATV